MNQAEAFCRELQVLGRSGAPKLARRYRARRLKDGCYTFPDGSTVRRTDPHIFEAQSLITAKFWIGGGR